MRGEIEQATKCIERYSEEPAQISTKQLAKALLQGRALPDRRKACTEDLNSITIDFFGK